MCVRAPYKFENGRPIIQSIVRLHGDHISVLKKDPQCRGTHPKETNLIGRHPPKGTKPIEGHLQKETESIGKETEKIDRESPLNTNPQHINCLHQTHYISSYRTYATDISIHSMRYRGWRWESYRRTACCGNQRSCERRKH